MKRRVKKIASSLLAAALVAVDTAAAVSPDLLLQYRRYQQPVVFDHSTKTVIIHWSRQIGKSHSLAGWTIQRLLLQLQTHPTWLVTVLSNSRANGGEFMLKCHEAARKMNQAFSEDGNRQELDGRHDLSEDAKTELMRFELRLTVGDKLGRIIVLAANVRTARGFSGDLVLDEFAFHQDSRGIWEAAEPIISANKDFLCRIASTGNGRRNMFYQLIAEGRIPYYKITRSAAWKSGELKIYSNINGKELNPDEARGQASDKRAYDQNYECLFADEATALLTQELISLAEREGLRIDEDEWSEATVRRLAACRNPLYLGNDVGRRVDLSVQYVLEKIGAGFRTAGILRMSGKRLPAQQRQLARICTLPQFAGGCIDMTGLGLGLVEYAQEEVWGRTRIVGVDFGTSEPLTPRLRNDGRKGEKARVTEIMATELLGVFEDRRIEIPADAQLRDDLRKPERLTTSTGRVSIAAVRDEGGHADHFWALALAIRASSQVAGPLVVERVTRGYADESAGEGSLRNQLAAL